MLITLRFFVVVFFPAGLMIHSQGTSLDPCRLAPFVCLLVYGFFCFFSSRTDDPFTRDTTRSVQSGAISDRFSCPGTPRSSTLPAVLPVLPSAPSRSRRRRLCRRLSLEPAHTSHDPLPPSSGSLELHLTSG